MPLSTTTWADAWGDDAAPPGPVSSSDARPSRAAISARVATTVAKRPEQPPLAEDIDAVLMEIAKLRTDLARRDAITIVVVGVLLTAILQHISRMHEEFHLMASRVGILR